MTTSDAAAAGWIITQDSRPRQSTTCNAMFGPANKSRAYMISTRQPHKRLTIYIIDWTYCVALSRLIAKIWLPISTND